MSTPNTYEEARKQLQDTVTKLERGGGQLSEQIELWQRGKELAKLCQDYLQEADAKIKEATGQGSNF